MSAVDVLGRKAVQGIVLGTGTGGSTTARKLQCDLVCMSGGWSPAVHLTSHGGIKPRYLEEIHALVPGVMPQVNSEPAR